MIIIIIIIIIISINYIIKTVICPLGISQREKYIQNNKVNKFHKKGIF